MKPNLTPALRRMIGARTTLMLSEPFFGSLAFRLKLQEDPSCKTAWTDGTTIGFNPEYVTGLTTDQLTGLLCHEVLHCANGHPWRRDGRDPKQWNIACDLAINPIIIESGKKLPDGVLLDPQHSGKSAEYIFNRLPKPGDDDNGQGQPQPGNGQPSPNGQPQPGNGTPDDGTPDDDGEPAPGNGGTDVRDAPTATADDSPVTEEDWKQAVQQAATAAKARGDLPGSLDRYAKAAVQPKADWRSALRRFVQQTAQADYSWKQPNGRYLARGLYLPALRSEVCGPIAVAIDTSGSIDRETLSQFGAEIQSIVDEVKPSLVSLIWCDARVHRIDTFTPDEPLVFKPVGGGGTDFRPAFEALEDFDEPPVCMIYLTDLEGTFPETDPEIPTLWAVTGSETEVPFGEVITLDT